MIFQMYILMIIEFVLSCILLLKSVTDVRKKHSKFYIHTHSNTNIYLYKSMGAKMLVLSENGGN